MAPETPLLVQLSRLVFKNNFLSSEFSSNIFHQKLGIAMGTPFAVTAANAFMYYHDKDIVTAMYLTLYKRLSDDIFVIQTGRRKTLTESLDRCS